jgi:WXG100 family type VII secretion target
MSSSGNMEFNTSNAETVARNIDSRASEIAAAMKKIQEQMQNVSQWWKGESQKAYSAQYAKIEPNVNKLIESVKTISEQLKQTAKFKEDAEQAMARELSKTN